MLSKTFSGVNWRRLSQFVLDIGRETLNSYARTWKWILVDIDRVAKRRDKYPLLLTNTEIYNFFFSFYLVRILPSPPLPPPPQKQNK